MLHVYLGRFAPFHEGHRMLLNRLIKIFGINNCLVLIGSANVINGRTPFTFKERKLMIQKHFPDIKVLSLDDLDNDPDWLKSIHKLEDELKDKFIFYGGSTTDLQIISQEFETHVLVDRFTEGKGINATEIRKKMGIGS
jgi:cytidyltransferase-like protein